MALAFSNPYTLVIDFGKNIFIDRVSIFDNIKESIASYK